MRRILLPTALLTTLLTVLTVAPAAAHPVANTYRIAVGVRTSVPILVPADYGKPIGEVDVLAPSGFRIDAAEPPGGWQLVTHGQSVTFTGGPMPAYFVGLVFTVSGTATGSGRLSFEVTTKSPDGTVMQYGDYGNGGPGPVVYAGSAQRSGGSSVPWKPLGGVALVAIGLGGTVIVRRRSARRA
jgi:hypothetical protein